MMHTTARCKPIVPHARWWAFPVLVAWVSLGAFPRQAAALTIAPPAHLGELAEMSEAVCMAGVLDAAAVERGALVVTHTRLTVLESLAGPLRAGDTIVVETPGGRAGATEWLVPGSPALDPGASFLLFLHRKAPGLWTPAMLAYGVFREETNGAGVPVLTPVESARSLRVPDGRSVAPLRPYLRDALCAHLRDVASGRNVWSGAGLEAPDTLGAKDLGDKSAECVYFTSAGLKLRWREFDGAGTAVIHATDDGDASVPGGGFVEAVRSLDLWMGIEGTGLNLALGGVRPRSITCGEGTDFQAGTIVFNDPCDDMAPLNACTGVLAYGGPLISGRHRFQGAWWGTIVGWFVVVNEGAGCIGRSNYTRMMAHELGHGLGYDHVDDAGALMYMYCCNPINATDEHCARTTYPVLTPGNRRPAIDAGGDRELVLDGDTARLEAVVDDDGLPASPGRVSVAWRQITGPAQAQIADPGAAAADVRFPVDGIYLLTATADDGELIRSDVIVLRVQINAAPVQPYFIRGDATDDGVVNLADAINVLEVLFHGGRVWACPDAADANDDGHVDLSDAVALLRYLFGGASLPAPQGACGPDPTPDALGPCESQVCPPGP